MPPPPPKTRTASVTRILWVILALNLLVTVVKLVIGFSTGALAVVADGFHSLVDSSSNIVGLFGVWVASRPIDENHPYGHRRYETIATLGIGGLLLAAAWEIARAIFERLSGGAPQDVTPLTLVLVALTFPVNLAIVIFETRAGKRLNSEILLADALHTRTDLYVTLGVLASLAGALAGLPWLDLVVAAIVVGVIARAALGILYKASLVLTDSAAANPETVAAIASDVPGVRFVHGVRSRGSADDIHLDLHVKVNPAMTTSQAHSIASEVERRLITGIPNVVDAIVHIEPGHGEAHDLWKDMSLGLRELAEGMGLAMHELHIHTESGGGFAVEMHLEMDAALSLGEAHSLADELESRTKKRWPSIVTFVTHLEPLATAVPEEAGTPEAAAGLERRIRQLADEMCGEGTCHSIELHRVEGHLTATLHITQPARKPLLQAHALAEEVERRLLTELPRLQRVVVHVEPPE